MTDNGASAIVRSLAIEETRHVFGIPGTQNLPLLDVIRETPSMRFILSRHEQAAGFMGYGYASVARKPSIVTATEGPGATNLVTPIAAAYKGEVPIIALSGAVDRQLLERDASQDIDQRAMFRPITRWASTVPSGSKAPEFIQKAFRRATGTPNGPVHLDVSREILLEDVDWTPLAPSNYRTMSIPDCSDSDLDLVFALLQRSERPLILTGAEQMYEEAGIELIKLAEVLGAPVVTNQEHLDAFPSVHWLSLGALGRSAWGPTLDEARRADLLLVVGAKLDTATTLMNDSIIAPETQIIFNTKNADRVGNVFPVECSVIGSIQSFIKGLHERIISTNCEKKWLDTSRIRALADNWRRARRDPNAMPVQVPVVTHIVRQRLEEDAIVCIDAGNATKHVRSHWDTYKPFSFFASDEFGSVGCAFPMAMGAKLAAPERQVVAFAGDMGFSCNLSELETCVREGINIVMVVLNDHGLGNEKAYQQALYGGRYFAVDYTPLDFAAISRAFGAHSERVVTLDEFAPALERSLDCGKPAVIEVEIDPFNLAPVVMKRS